jgi:hypothetical protein
MEYKTGFQREFLKASTLYVRQFLHSRLYGSGRAAFLDILNEFKKQGRHRIWLPAWICRELPEAILRFGGFEICYYRLTDDFRPLIENEAVKLNSDVFVLVDYFGCITDTVLQDVTHRTQVPIIIDAVHSWLAGDVAIPDHVTVISGFRKVFFKGVGCLVTGKICNKLSLLPSFIPPSAPGFPRNLTLATRFGVLGYFVLSFLNFEFMNALCLQWPRRADRNTDLLSNLRCPAKLIDYTLTPRSRDLSRFECCQWPFLPDNLSEQLLLNAVHLKEKYWVQFPPQSR